MHNLSSKVQVQRRLLALSASTRVKAQMITPPTGLTRFYGNTSFGLDVLNKQHVALVRVTLLNDPFDPYGFFETDFGNYIDLFKYVRAHHPRDLGWFRVHVTAQSWGRPTALHDSPSHRYVRAVRERPDRDDAPEG